MARHETASRNSRCRERSVPRVGQHAEEALPTDDPDGMTENLLVLAGEVDLSVRLAYLCIVWRTKIFIPSEDS